MKHYKLNQQGAVSILSVTIFAIILTLLATAYITSVVALQKNAINFDLSTRAYYAAESGVQDAIRAISQNPLSADKNDCPPLASGGIIGASTAYGLGYTCQIITMQPADLKGQVDDHAKNATMRLEPTTNETGFLKLIVRWSERASPLVFYPRATTDQYFSPTTDWYRGGNTAQPIHAVLRVNIITHPRTGSFSRSAIKQRVVLLNPTATPGASPSFRIDGTSADTIPLQQEDFVNNARCYQSNIAPSDYACEQTILLREGYNLANQQLYVRISSIYHPTGFSVSLTRDNNTAINIRNGQALIDVTGKAGGSTFRRVQQAVSLGGYAEDNFPDAALIAGEGICKLFAIGTQASHYQQGCNPLAAN